jgi:arylsulfatase A-like enzyme
MPLPAVLNQQADKRKFQFTKKERADIAALYNGEIKYTDEFLIKPVVQKLKELNLYDRTLIILTSDHGEEFMDHESWLHGHTLYNELIKVPLIIKYPKSTDKGRRVDRIVRSIDIIPTILETVGIDASPFDMDGKSVQRIVLGREDQNRTYFSDFSRGGSSELRPIMVCTNQDFYKFILNRRPSPPKTFLFDLAEDVRETKNLENTQPAREREMFQSILEYYENFKEVALKSDKIVLDKALEEKLRALGYIR